MISAPDMRESDDEVDESDDDLVRTFWRKMMERHGGEDAYNKTIIEQFKGPADPDIIIVVDKLLTGFDAPRNTVLYVARKLREHGLLQAIARVNRVFDEDGAPEKPFGYIVDYTGIFKNLGEALSAYDQLEGFSEADIAQSIVSIRDERPKCLAPTPRCSTSSSRCRTPMMRRLTPGSWLMQWCAKNSTVGSRIQPRPGRRIGLPKLR